MELHELGAVLNDMYFNSPEKETVAMIHLFGIKYAKEIESLDSSFKEIAIAAGINESYGTEISKGAKLSKYVTVK